MVDFKIENRIRLKDGYSEDLRLQTHGWDGQSLGQKWGKAARQSPLGSSEVFVSEPSTAAVLTSPSATVLKFIYRQFYLGT